MLKSTFGDLSRGSISTACMHVIRRDHTTPTGFPAVPTASGMTDVMLEKQHEQWGHVWRALCPLVIVKRCSGPALDRLRTEAQMGENGGRTTGQLLSHGPCACLAWCLMSLAHIHRVGTASVAVTDDLNGRCRKILILQGCSSKGYSSGRSGLRLQNRQRRAYRSCWPRA